MSSPLCADAIAGSDRADRWGRSQRSSSFRKGGGRSRLSHSRREPRRGRGSPLWRRRLFAEVLSRSIDQPAAHCDCDGVCPRACPELAKQVVHVRLDRLLREEQMRGDLMVEEPVGDEFENFELALGRGLLDLGDRQEGVLE